MQIWHWCGRTTYKGGKLIEADPQLDWAGNLAHMMGACSVKDHTSRSIIAAA